MDLNKEMSEPRSEIEETLPIEQSPETSEPKKEEEDYLDYQDKKTMSQPQYSQPVMFNNEREDNLIKDLLNVDWERIEHIIRGHVPKTDLKTGDEYFTEIKDHYLNGYGVNSILHFLSFYLSPEIKLARYSKDEVKMIMSQFASQFTDFFFDNVNEFGLNTPKKKKMSNMFVRAVIDLVDSAYSKAIEGKTAEMVFKQFQVLQNQPIESYSPTNEIQRPKRGVFQRIFG